jgi:hypothetical protein
MKKLIVMFLACLGLPCFSVAGDFSVDTLVYEGAFRIPGGTFGVSRMGYANGAFTVAPSGTSFFVVGHSQHQAIAEFEIPELSKSDKIEQLTMADAPIQPFTSVLGRVQGGNPESINTITGLSFIDNKLLVNAAQYYDGSSSNNNTTFIIDDPSNLSESNIRGFYNLEARHHAAGWIAPIPPAVKVELNYDYVVGNASNLPINGRSSMGPSAFGVNSEDLMGLDEPGEVIPTRAWLDFSIDNQLHPDHYNREGGNDIWTEVSNAYFGFFVPGTTTYAVFGNSGGHEYGIGYKITQDTGRECGGACVKVASDQYNYFWLWDLADLKSVNEGRKEPYEILPFDYGEVDLKFSKIATSDIPRTIIGAHYNYSNGKLYFLLGNADRLQSQYEGIPIMLVYSFGLNRPGVPENFEVQ